MRFIILPVVSVSLLVGCAITDIRSEPQEEKEYVTGSNIPRKGRSASDVSVLGKEAVEKIQNSSSGSTTRGSELPR